MECIAHISMNLGLLAHQSRWTESRWVMLAKSQREKLTVRMALLPRGQQNLLSLSPEEKCRIALLVSQFSLSQRGWGMDLCNSWRIAEKRGWQCRMNKNCAEVGKKAVLYLATLWQDMPWWNPVAWSRYSVIACGGFYKPIKSIQLMWQKINASFWPDLYLGRSQKQTPPNQRGHVHLYVVTQVDDLRHGSKLDLCCLTPQNIPANKTQPSYHSQISVTCTSEKSDSSR